MTTKEEILEGAKTLFERFGFDKTSMDDIANKVHKAKRSIYNHFENKEVLFSEVVRQEIDAFSQKLQSIFQNEQLDILGQLNQYLLKRAELIAESSIYKMVLADDHKLSDEQKFLQVQNSMQEFDRWEYGLFVSVWNHKPVEDCEEVDPIEALAFADMLQMSIKGLDYSLFVKDKYESYKSSYENLVTLVINSVRVNCINNLKR